MVVDHEKRGWPRSVSWSKRSAERKSFSTARSVLSTPPELQITIDLAKALTTTADQSERYLSWPARPLRGVLLLSNLCFLSFVLSFSIVSLAIPCQNAGVLPGRGRGGPEGDLLDRREDAAALARERLKDRERELHQAFGN